MVKRYAVTMEASILEALEESVLVRPDGAIVTLGHSLHPMYVGLSRIEVPGIEAWIALELTLHVERPAQRRLIRRLLVPWLRKRESVR